MNGSNLYRESTCVICLGLNRFEPREYISRTLALDFDDYITTKGSGRHTVYRKKPQTEGIASAIPTRHILYQGGGHHKEKHTDSGHRTLSAK